MTAENEAETAQVSKEIFTIMVKTICECLPDKKDIPRVLMSIGMSALGTVVNGAKCQERRDGIKQFLRGYLEDTFNKVEAEHAQADKKDSERCEEGRKDCKKGKKRSKQPSEEGHQAG